jgi:hypothetical protein
MTALATATRPLLSGEAVSWTGPFFTISAGACALDRFCQCPDDTGGPSDAFLTDKPLTRAVWMGKIREIGGVVERDKKWIFGFLVLTV